MADDSLCRWEPLSVEEVAHLFDGVSAPWWIAGGWAIDLFLHAVTRTHDDIDVGMLRADQAWIHRVLAGWDIQAADPPGTLRPWIAGECLPQGIHDIWCREHPSAPWRLQFMLNESDGSDWVFRRDPAIRRPMATTTRRTPEGVPYMCPEIQLLFKSRGNRPKDEADLRNCLPRMTSDARHWLIENLRKEAPAHPWLAVLDADS